VVSCIIVSQLYNGIFEHLAIKLHANTSKCGINKWLKDNWYCHLLLLKYYISYVTMFAFVKIIVYFLQLRHKEYMNMSVSSATDSYIWLCHSDLSSTNPNTPRTYNLNKLTVKCQHCNSGTVHICLWKVYELVKTWKMGSYNCTVFNGSFVQIRSLLSVLFVSLK